MISSNEVLGSIRQVTYIHHTLKNRKHMYGLKCGYYKKKFSTLNELLEDIITSGMDPNYMITRDGKSTGEQAINLIQM